MKKFLQKKLNQKGLTLVELLAVIVILGIIAAIAVPAIGNIIANTKYNAVKADALNALNASSLYFADEPTKENVTVATLVSDGYLENAGKLSGLDGQGTVAVTIKNANIKTITSAAITYASGKTVIFSGSTIDSINKDKQKGSKIDEITVPAT